MKENLVESPQNESGFEILNERPAGMSYQDYRMERTLQRERLKIRRKGTMVYCAAEIVKGDKSSLDLASGQLSGKSGGHIKSYGSFVGVAKNLKPL